LKENRLTPIKFVYRRDRRDYWLCRCSCGKEKIIRLVYVLSNFTRSCGCIRLKHGGSIRGARESLYTIWANMHRRCENPNDAAYGYYGGRGIYVCERWKDYANFRQDVSPRSPGLTLDRIDNDGPYSPENCRWASRQEQAENMSNNHILTLNGESGTLASWARRLGMNWVSLARRLERGWPIEKALTQPPQHRPRRAQ